MSSIRFWIALLMSGGLHAGVLAVALVGIRAPDTPPELLEPWGNSDREGFDVGTISVNPGTWRQGDQHTPGGDDAPEQPQAAPVEDEPLPVTVIPAPSTPLLPAALPAPAPAETPAKVAEKSEGTTPVANGGTTEKKPGLPGAPGGANMQIGTPSKGGIVGKPSGVKLLQGGRKTYPAEAARLGQEGTVWVWLRISEDGDVVEVKLHRSCGYPLLDAAAQRYAQTMKFRPARRGDTAVESTAIQPIEYELP